MGERDGGFDQRLRMRLGQGAFPPEFHGLPLDGDAGGVAEMAVAVAEVGPGFADDGLGRDIAAVKSFQHAAHLHFFREQWRAGGRGGLGTGVGDAIKGALGAATANGEVHRAVDRADHDIGEGQGFAKEELLLLGGVAATVRREVNGPHGAVGPVVDEDGTLILGGELGLRSSDNTGGASGADVERGGEAVGIVLRPLARAAAPSEISAADRMVHAGGAVPGGADVPLHVGVVGEEVACRIEGDVELVAEAVAEQLHVAAIGLHRGDEATGGQLAPGVAIGVPHARQEMILRPDLGGPAATELVGEVGVVASVEVDPLAIRADGHGVQSVLAPAAHGDELLDVVVLVIAVRILESVEAIFLPVLVDHDVEAVEGMEQTVRLAHGHTQSFRLGFLGHIHPIEAAILIGSDEATLVINGEGDPGALFVFGDDVELFDGEAVGDGDVLGLNGNAAAAFLAGLGLSIEREPPWSISVLGDHDCRFPFFGSGGRGFPCRTRFEDQFLHVRQFDRELRDQASAAALVACIDLKFIRLTGLDELCCVHLSRVLPIGIRSNELAVQVGLGPVVAGDAELRKMGVVREIEALAEGNLLAIAGLLRQPDPLGGGVSGGGEGEKKEREEACRNHGRSKKAQFGRAVNVAPRPQIAPR